MSDSEDDDDLPREKVKKTLLSLTDRQTSKSRLDYKGVKSYLHQFYEYTKDPNAGGFDDEVLGKPGRQLRVRSIYWRVILVTGLFLMALGLFAVLLSYLIPRKSVIVEEEDDFALVDKEAAMFNRNLEYLKLTGLVTFCIGGIGSSLALLLASCCFRRCNALDRTSEESEDSMVKKMVDETGDQDEYQAPSSPIDFKIPGQESVFGVQPDAGETSESAYPLIGTSTPH
jgi:hypothetical protein